ncbi:hypothetical protein V6N13_118569 [Hibiscus sabdariffa]
MEPLRKQRNPDLIMDPNILLSASISYDEMGKYERYTRMITSLILLTKSLAQQKRNRHTKSLSIRYLIGFELGKTDPTIGSRTSRNLRVGSSKKSQWSGQRRSNFWSKSWRSGATRCMGALVHPRSGIQCGRVHGRLGAPTCSDPMQQGADSRPLAVAARGRPSGSQTAAASSLPTILRLLVSVVASVSVLG